MPMADSNRSWRSVVLVDSGPDGASLRPVHWYRVFAVASSAAEAGPGLDGDPRALPRASRKQKKISWYSGPPRGQTLGPGVLLLVVAATMPRAAGGGPPGSGLLAWGGAWPPLWVAAPWGRQLEAPAAGGPWSPGAANLNGGPRKQTPESESWSRNPEGLPDSSSRFRREMGTKSPFPGRPGTGIGASESGAAAAGRGFRPLGDCPVSATLARALWQAHCELQVSLPDSGGAS